jgi:hypothetical protein
MKKLINDARKSFSIWEAQRLSETKISRRTGSRCSSEAVGKVVEKIKEHDEYFTVLFTDGTALVAEASHSYGGENCNIDVTTSPFDHYSMMYSGLITEAELDEYYAKQKVIDEKRKENRERIEYERLKAKFDK